jgi:HK97 family phage major capsid protein
LADLTADGGLLQPAQAQKFIRILIKESVLLKMATVVPMGSPKQLMPKIRFAGRILRAGAEAAALPASERAKPELSQVELDAKLFKAEVRLSNEVLEDSIERGALRQTIMQLIGEQVATDMDEIIAQGDTASADPTLAQLDGILKQATSHVVDAAGAATSKAIFHDMLRSMPSEYLRSRKELRFLTSVDSELDYRDSLSERATAAGDRYLTEDVPVAYSGIPIRDVPLFPENLGANANTTNILLTHPKNIHVGLWRQIRIETDKDVSAGMLIIVATLRFDVKFAEEQAVVKAINVAVA